MAGEARHERVSAAVWDWRRDVEGASAAEGAARARRGGFLRSGIGLLVAAALALWKPVLGIVAGALAFTVLALALLAPRTLYPLLEGWIAAFARGVGVAVSWITLTSVHLLVFVPLGLLLRATGRLRIGPAPDREATTYWRPADSIARHDRQF